MSLQVPPNGTGSVIDTNTIGSKERQNVSIGDPVTVANVAKVDVGQNLSTQSGGNNTTAVAAAAAAAAIKASAGRLRKILITALGTAAVSFYDNASAASGTIIAYIPASQAAGSILTFDMSAANGIWCASTTNTPAMTVSWD